VRIYREGMLPMVGAAAARAALAKRGRRVELAPGQHGMSASRDLGYSYGLLFARASAGARPDTVSYLHVWRRTAEGAWKLALDVENPFGAK
jgi:ketosteroid isomerase-like protein